MSIMSWFKDEDEGEIVLSRLQATQDVNSGDHADPPPPEPDPGPMT